MPPKTGTPLGVEEDVKFLLTIIKLAGVGTVSDPNSSFETDNMSSY